MLGTIVVATIVGFALSAGVVIYAAHGNPASLSGKHGPGLFPVALGGLIAYLPIVAVIARMLPWLAHRSLSALGLRLPTLRDVGIAAGSAVLMLMTVLAVAELQSSLLSEPPHQQVMELFKQARHDAGYYLLLSIAVVFAPFVEELVFRGFIFNAFLKYVPFATSMLASGAIFSAMHVFSGGEPQYSVFFPLFAGGMILAWVYYQTGSLTASMLTHGLFNGAQLLSLLIAQLASHAAPHARP